mmetsp:Transcript_8050/g.25917  ORF Transcript_8050/g.25917 Transcript_8050/m.25917 type:complete len:81 (+) Transcript_8050:2782-3024(+)|eukprot:scaffold26293_cov112-Isochrysis_galbana.AAC.6
MLRNESGGDDSADDASTLRARESRLLRLVRRLLCSQLHCGVAKGLEVRLNRVKTCSRVLGPGARAEAGPLAAMTGIGTAI